MRGACTLTGSSTSDLKFLHLTISESSTLFSYGAFGSTGMEYDSSGVEVEVDVEFFMWRLRLRLRWRWSCEPLTS